MMTRFFNAWQAVANRPEDRAVRTALVEEARSLALTFRQTDQQLEQLRFDINRQLEIKTTQVNDLAQQVATLNAQIGQVEGSGQQANDLRDQRDQLVNRLASLTRVSQSENTNGVINLYVSGRALVLGDVASPMTAALTGGGDVSVQWQSDGATVSLGSGELAGLARVRDTTLAQQRTGLNSLVTTLITEVNALHTTGYGLTDASAPNRAFFTGTNATTIAVNGTIETTPELLAVAGAPNLPGDNSIGLAIAKLRDGLTMGGGTATFQAYYRSQTATLGTAARQAVTTAQNQQVLVDMLNRRQESFSGVNIDEETTNLIKFQHAYQAAARVITTVDDMLDRVINRMGRVGL
jgi:flagellar hook-associated protein 1 FlgK